MGIPGRSDDTPRPRPRRIVAWLAALAAFALVAACSGSEEAGSADSTPAPDPEPVASAPVDAASPMPSAEPADSTVTGTDYAFDATDVAAGDAVALVNESDVEAHEMVVMKVTDDAVTLEEIQQLLAEDPDAPPPDFLEEAGFAFAMPGETSEQTVRFDQGRYLLLCFIPQNAPPEAVAQMMESSEPPELPSDTGPPHVALGMVDLVEVE